MRFAAIFSCVVLFTLHTVFCRAKVFKFDEVQFVSVVQSTVSLSVAVTAWCGPSSIKHTLPEDLPSTKHLLRVGDTTVRKMHTS